MSNFGYCELQVDLGTGVKLQRAMAKRLNPELELIPINKLHATIMYDVRDPEIYPSKSSEVYKCKVVGTKILGEPNSKWYSAALLLDSPEVQARHQQLLKEGFKHSYDDLLLHVSISYGKTTAALAPILGEMFEAGELPATVTLCNETWDHCNDD